MAMDKNEKLRLFKKIPAVDETQLPTPFERLEFLDIQILERKKVLYRQVVQVKQAEFFADLDDVQANKTAENFATEAVDYIKGLKHELASLELTRKQLISTIPAAELTDFYRGQQMAGKVVPAEWLARTENTVETTE